MVALHVKSYSIYLTYIFTPPIYLSTHIHKCVCMCVCVCVCVKYQSISISLYIYARTRTRTHIFNVPVSNNSSGTFALGLISDIARIAIIMDMAYVD